MLLCLDWAAAEAAQGGGSVHWEHPPIVPKPLPWLLLLLLLVLLVVRIDKKSHHSLLLCIMSVAIFSDIFTRKQILNSTQNFCLKWDY